MVRSIVVGTAGHIDHGKTALVRALTGVNTDRLDEEQRRGITIELGFAPLDLEGGVHIGFVDVPGHERFVKNMLAGAGGIDAVLIVVAADESIMPQTREHVEICDLLQIDTAVVALTKIDLVDEDIVDLASLEIAEFLETTRFSGAPIVPVSAVTGAGLDDLRSALAGLADGVAERSESLVARLPVDRVFTMKGFGTVVTGTLIAGRLREGEQVELQPSGKASTIKNLQVHGESVKEASAGHRVAVNLAGLSTDNIERGDTLVPAGALAPSAILDLSCDVLGSSPCDLVPNQRVRLHIGSAEIIGRLQILSGERIAVGGHGYVRIRLESPAAALIGDRYVLRRYSPMITIAGGEVVGNSGERIFHRTEHLEMLAKVHAADINERCALLLAATSGPLTPDLLTRRFGLLESRAAEMLTALADEGRAVLLSESPLSVCSAEFIEAAEKGITAELERAHDASPYSDGFGLEALRRGLPRGADESVFRVALEQLKQRGDVELFSGKAALADRRVDLSAQQQAWMEGIVAAIRGGGTAPPPASQVVKENGGSEARPLFKLLITRSELVRIADDLFYHRDTIEEIVATIRNNAGEDGFSVPEFKDWLGITRKFAIPLLEYMDGAGVTYRDGDMRRLSRANPS